MAKAKKEEKASNLSSELQAAIKALNDSYGPGTITAMMDLPAEADRVSTGSLVLDIALSGGYPRGHIIEIFGPESTGKSTLSLHFLAQFSGPKLLLDFEQSFSRDYAERIGVDLKNTFIVQPSNMEEGADILVKLLPNMEAVVFDSIAEAVPKREMEGDMSTEATGVKAKKMHHLMRLIKGTKHNATILFVNQMIQNIGQMYGPTTTTAGGSATKYGTHVRLDIFKKELIKRGSTEEVTGHYMHIRLAKNKLGVPHIKCQVPIIFDGFGVSKSQEIIDVGIACGVLEQSGAWIRYNGDLVGQGAEKARQFLSDNLELRQELEDKIRSFNNNSSNNSSSAK